MSDEFVDNFQKFSGDNFFKLLEQHFKTVIPTLIKKNLELCDYNCAIVLAKLDDARIDAIEEDIRNTFDDQLKRPCETKEDYLGRFSNCQSKFKFLDGQRTWLKLIGQTCRQFLEITEPSSVVANAGESSSQSISENSISRSVHASVNEENLQDLKTLIFEWIRAQVKLSDSIKQDLVFDIVDQSQKGQVLLKCPVRECETTITVSFKSYVKYFKRKNPSTEDRFSKPKWYVYSVHTHLLKYHKCDNHEHGSDNSDSELNDDRLRSDNGNERNDSFSSSSNEEFRGFQLNANHNTNSNSIDESLVQRIHTAEIPENDGQSRENPGKSRENLRKRKIASNQVVSPLKKRKA